jgi:hypothetical protein
MHPVSDSRFDNLSTLWTLVRRAHGETTEAAAQARGELLQRYRGAAYRYLLATVRDPDTAEELSQDFALKFLRGDFRHAHPDRGRFRDYLRSSLAHLIKSHPGAPGGYVPLFGWKSNAGIAVGSAASPAARRSTCA